MAFRAAKVCFDPKRIFATLRFVSPGQVLPVIGVAIRSVRIREVDPTTKRIG